MKRIFPLAVMVLTAGSAFAADLPSRKAEPMLPPPPPPMWNGFYAGLNLGGVTNTSTSASTTGFSTYDWAAEHYNLPFGWTSGYRTGNANVGASGVIGGGQIGYNYLVNPSILLGFETDFQGSSMSGGGSFAALAGAPGNLAAPDNFLHLQSGNVNVSWPAPMG